MQISPKGMRIVGIRTTYDSARQRGVGSQVISFRSYLNTIEEIRTVEPKGALQLDGLKADELSQLKAWLLKRSNDREQASNQAAVRNLERQLDLALKALDTESGQLGLTSDLASRLYVKIRDLQMAMKKAGHSRPLVGDAKKGS
ncbi:hypothetical protein IFT48_00590 [Pseudomonas fluorescens]|uniref:hypothetical protein n=1 Tax=Pseudomonas TaxID=286 RepID=UPI000F0134DC|nr:MULTISPECIES: hypothetical protein [Pseudomonas]MBD8088488.1 hypothetical protein [Pseudomonas fluorescens]MBD8615065.1 hypothetical protein [Pseudomonas putida]MBD8681259.1 hypothetical protein [Pseudomonas sp. CFBP 13719]